MRISDWSSDVCSSDLLVLGGVLLRVRVEDATLGLALAGEGHVVRRVGPVQQPRDDAVLTLVDRRRAGLPAHRAVNGLDGRSEDHTSELQSLMRISYAVFCLKKKKNNDREINHQRYTLYH